MKFPTKIPTPIGFLLLVIVVGGAIASFETISRLPTRATGSKEPENVQITNLSDTSFTFTWTTGTPATGMLAVTTPQREITAFDERDGNGKLTPYITHTITIRNLTGDTEYLIKILSNGKTYFDNDKPYRVRTTPILTTSPGNLGPAYGSVMTGDNKAASGALVFLTLEGSQTLSTLVKPSGAWIIPLNLIRTQDGTSYLSASADRITENLLVRSDGEQSSAITDTLNNSPVPSMVLGKTYDFRKQQAKRTEQSPIALAPLGPKTTPAVLGTQTTQAQYTVSLVAPAEGVALTSQFPLIQGTGIPGKFVTVTLGITSPISDTTTVGNDGIFRYTPKMQLAPGKQSVTITTLNAHDQPVAITHSFEILKNGTQVLGIATPSGTLTPTLAPLFTPTPTSTLAGLPLPTSATTFPTVALIIVGLSLFLGGTIAFIQ